jgi:hypothetical protein
MELDGHALPSFSSAELLLASSGTTAPRHHIPRAHVRQLLMHFSISTQRCLVLCNADFTNVSVNDESKSSFTLRERLMLQISSNFHDPGIVANTIVRIFE